MNITLPPMLTTGWNPDNINSKYPDAYAGHIELYFGDIVVKRWYIEDGYRYDTYNGSAFAEENITKFVAEKLKILFEDI